MNSDNVRTPMDYSVDVIIPTYKSDDKLNHLLFMLYRQTVVPNKVILLHTEEYPGQEQPIPKIPGSYIKIVPIDKASFDHGGTRRIGASMSDADILLFMTQDAVPADEYLIENLLKPYEDPLVAASYARQLAGKNADLLERYTRNYNYPKTSRIQSLDDIGELGIKTYFCSNVCASYKNSVYRKLGGFVDRTIFNEDMIYAFSMIDSDYRIAYSSDAKVVHSHSYSYPQHFSRNFDLGVSHKQYNKLFGSIKTEDEGVKFVKDTLSFLIDNNKYLLLPDFFLTTIFKYLGYRAGLIYDKLPMNIVKKFTMNKGYWD